MDLEIHESFNGGDVLFVGGDLRTTSALFNQVYIGLFGANDKDLPDDQNANWWGNDLFFPENQSSQFNSRFEKALSNTALSSSGLRKLEQIATQDLDFLSDLGEITVNISAVDSEEAKIEVFLKEAQGISERIFVMLWDATREEDIKVIN